MAAIRWKRLHCGNTDLLYGAAGFRMENPAAVLSRDLQVLYETQYDTERRTYGDARCPGDTVTEWK